MLFFDEFFKIYSWVGCSDSFSKELESNANLLLHKLCFRRFPPYHSVAARHALVQHIDWIRVVHHLDYDTGNNIFPKNEVYRLRFYK